MYLVDVIIEHPIRHLDTSFTYLSEIFIESGVRVRVSFNKQKLVGYVKECKETTLSKEALEQEAGYTFLWVDEVIDQRPLLTEELSQLCDYLSYSTFAPMISCIKMMLPPPLKPTSSSKTTQKRLKVIYFKQMVPSLTQRQEEVLLELKERKKVFLKDCSISRPLLSTLESRGAIEIKEEVVLREVESILEIEKKEIKLTKKQNEVLQQFLQGKNDKPYLLHGVTGSGKTEVYLQAAKQVLKHNKQVLMLVPEISLTPKIVALFKERFSNQVAILHSGLSDGQRYDEYLRIASQSVNIVIGARSAIFAPLKNIGLIIMDEEHDGSYKQTTSPTYHTKDIALWRCKYHQAKLLLGSASPSIESYARALSNKYYLLELPHRATNTTLASCKIVDMAKEAQNGNLTPFSKAFVEGFQRCITNKKQALILVNRRGYSSYLLCKECGYIPKCPHCDVSLTYHKNDQRLMCHYCGYTERYNKSCLNCHSDMVSFKGVGTEQMTELLYSYFKGIEIIRYDVDTTKNKLSHEKLLNQFESQKANVLLGTQMIAKGLDFKNVTFVGVLDGDGALSIPDYRSGERTFQLILQVAGRAGRHLESGEVVIQTYNPNHYAIVFGAKQDYHAFYKEEINTRRLANYPPFCYMLSIVISGKDENTCITTANKMATYLSNKVSDIQVLGPSVAVISKIKDQYRYRISVKYKNSKHLFKEIHELLKLTSSKVKIEVDVNPYSQM